MKQSQAPSPIPMPSSSTVVCWLTSGEAARRRVSSSAPTLIGNDSVLSSESTAAEAG